MVKYYPKEISVAKLIKEFPEMEWVNQADEQRLQDIASLKARGKGAPKKTKKNGTVFWQYFQALLKTNILVTEPSRRANRRRKGG